MNAFCKLGVTYDALFSFFQFPLSAFPCL